MYTVLYEVIIVEKNLSNMGERMWQLFPFASVPSRPSIESFSQVAQLIMKD